MENAVLFLMILLLSLTEFMIVFLLKRKVKKPPEEYEFLFSAKMANYVLEREWHKNQLVAQHEDGSVLLKFSSNQKQMVFSWAMGFGDSVTVIKPERLREEIREECRKMAGKYDT